MTTYSTHGSTLALFFESNFGQPPGYVAGTTPEGAAADWVTAEGTTAWRYRHIQVDPSFLRRQNIEDPSITPTVFGRYAPIRGLSTSDGGSFSLVFAGTGLTTSDSSQAAQDGIGMLLQHAFGGQIRTYTTAVAAAPSSDVSFDVGSATGLVPGAIVGVVDADVPGVVHNRRVLTVSGTSITLDEDFTDFDIAENDVIAAGHTYYVDSDALTDEADGGYSTVSILIQKNEGDGWLGVGGKLQIDRFNIVRGELVSMEVSVWAAGAFPPGADSPGAPVWTGTIQGISGAPIGRLTKLHIQQYGTTTSTCIHANEVEFVPGVPVIPRDYVTQCGDAGEGRGGYTTGPEVTTLTANVLLDTSYVGGFSTQQEYNVRYEFTGPRGQNWAFQLPRCYLREDPTYNEAVGTQMHRLVFEAHEDSITTGSNVALRRSKFVIHRGA